MKKMTALLLVCILVLSLSSAPVRGENARVFELEETVVYEKGITTVRWQDSADAAPYRVAYLCCDDAEAVQTVHWAGGDMESSTTNEKAFSLDTMTPGHQYRVEVIAGDGKILDQRILLPEAETFEDGKLKASSVKVEIAPKYWRPANEKAGRIDRFEAESIASHIDEWQFGIYYEIRLPELAYARTYLVQLAMTAPNGYTDTLATAKWTFDETNQFRHYFVFTGENFFSDMYKKNAAVPAGYYTVDLYFDGMLASSQRIRVY
ncbi:MAG: hypothetical protein J5564_05260 [Clostridia bacterium]|nr:hypothetical protein [Clostridia bacterium]